MDIWKHGKYLDLWSVVHFLSGFILCGFFYWLGLGLIHALTFSFALLVLWEGFEFIVKIIEPSLNVIVDILVGFLGSLIAAYIYFHTGMFDLSFYLIAVAVTGLLSLLGFLDYLKKGYR